MKKAIIFFLLIMTVCLVSKNATAQELKLGYVDLRRAFYEYDKSKTFDDELTDITTKRSEEREKKVDSITKLRDEAAMMSDDAKSQKQTEIDAKISDLNEFDKDTRKELLNRKNDMFREVVEDIQAVVDDIGAKEKYDYIFDARNIMYANPDKGYDLTDQILERINKK